MRSKLALTASALNGVPSWNLTSLRRRNVHSVPDGAMSHEVASQGWNFRSGPRLTRHSQMFLAVWLVQLLVARCGSRPSMLPSLEKRSVLPLTGAQLDSTTCFSPSGGYSQASGSTEPGLAEGAGAGAAAGFVAAAGRAAAAGGGVAAAGAAGGDAVVGGAAGAVVGAAVVGWAAGAVVGADAAGAQAASSGSDATSPAPARQVLNNARLEARRLGLPIRILHPSYASDPGAARTGLRPAAADRCYNVPPPSGRLLRVERLPQAVADHVDRDGRDEDGQARKHGGPPGPIHVVAPVAEDRAPLRRRRLRAESEEAEAGGRDDSLAEAERRHDDQRSQDARQQVAPHDPQVGATKAAGGLDVGVLLGRQRRATDQAGVARRPADAESDHRVVESRPQSGHDRQREEDARKRHQTVDQARDGEVDPAAVVASRHAEEQPEHDRDRDRAQPDAQRDARPVDDSAEDVSPEVIGAEQVAGRRRHEARPGLSRHGVVRRDQRSQQRDDDQRQQDERAHERGPMPRQPPGVLER